MKKIFFPIIITLLLACVIRADIYVKSKIHTDAISIMGQTQPAQDTVSEQWIGEDQLATLSEQQGFIFDWKKNVAYVINHEDKTYVETTLPFDFTKIVPPEMAQMMSSMMKMTVTVSPTTQTKTIGQWKCIGYEANISMMMMPMKMMVWATEDVPFDLNKYLEKMMTNVLKAQLKLDDAAVKEMMKIKGFWIATETTMEMMGAKTRSTTEVLEISEKNPPPEVYSVPSGYKKQDKISMKEMRE